MTLGKKLANSLLTALLIAVLFITALPSVAIRAETGQLTVGPDIIRLAVNSGSTSALLLTISSESPINLSLMGMGQTTAGSPYPVPTNQDTSTYTCRPWINLSDTQLSPGNNQTVAISITVPAGVNPGQRYASIMVTSWEGLSNILVPIILTVDEAAFTPAPSGEITSISVPPVYQWKPVHVLTSFTNTGNCLMTRAIINVVIKDSAGTEVWHNNNFMQEPSVMPYYPRTVDTVHATGLPAGNYSVTSRISLADNGPVYDMTSTFTVLEPIPPPAVPTLVGPVPVSGTEPGPVINIFTPTFQWNAVPGAAVYNLTIRSKPFGTTDLIYEKELTVTSFDLPSGYIWGGQEYCWQVIASNVYGDSAPATAYFQTYGTPIRTRTIDAINVTSTTATLVGDLLSLGTDGSVSVDFEYGLTTGYGQKSESQIRTATGDFAIPVTGLIPDKEYHFRMHALGTSDAWGGDVIFKTPNQIPTISNISPGSGEAGVILTLTGTNFNEGTTVTFNGMHSQNVSVTSPTTLRAGVPDLGNANINNVTITITNSGGSVSSTAFNYIGLQPPTLTGISPSSASAGQTVTLTGTYFINGTTVSFNGIAGTDVVINSRTSLTVKVPNLGRTNINGVTVTVTNSAGSATILNFNYTAPTPTTTPPTTTPAPTTTTPPAPLPSPPPADTLTGGAAYYLLKGMDEASLVVFSFDEQGSFASAVNEAGLEVYLSDFKGHGVIALARYQEIPEAEILFSDPISRGGTGKPQIKFVDVFVEGVRQGKASATVYFTEAEIQGYDPASLFLAYYFNGKWNRCGNINISQNELAVTGDIPVNRLTGTVVGLGGSFKNEIPAVVGPITSTNQPSPGNGVPWAYAGIVLATAAVIGVLLLVLGRNRRNKNS